MSIRIRIAAAALSTLVSITTMSSTSDAKPVGWGVGVGVGIAAAAIVGSAIAANDGYPYDGYRRCGWVRQFDAFGNYVGRVRTCGY